jgi:hypothetical protein
MSSRIKINRADHSGITHHWGRHMDIKRNLSLITDNNFKLLLDMYAQWCQMYGMDGAKDKLFKAMLGSENILNLMFFLATDKISDIVENSPAKSLNTFAKHFCGGMQ